MSSGLVRKCILSFAMGSVRPVNRVLGFGIRGITPVALSPWMLTCNRSNAVACLTDTLNKHSTHSQVSINKCAVVSVKVVSARKEARSAHVEISKMDVQDEGRKERRALKAQSCREVKHACVYFYRNTNTCPDFSDPPLGLCHSSVVYCLWRVGSTF